MQMVNEQNFNKLTVAWRNKYVSIVTAGHLVLSKTRENVFTLSTVKGLIITSKEVTLSPFETQTVPGVSRVTGHVKQVHVIAEPREQGFSSEVVTTSMYSDLKPGSSRFTICLLNLTSKQVTIPAQCVVGQIQAANEVTGMYAPVTPKVHLISRATIPKNENWLSTVPIADGKEDLSWFPADAKPKAPTPDRTIHKQIDLSGCISWSPEVMDLLSGFADVFSRHDLDLGETLMVEHEIKLKLNSCPFHERYFPIPQSMYEEV